MNASIPNNVRQNAFMIRYLCTNVFQPLIVPNLLALAYMYSFIAERNGILWERKTKGIMPKFCV